MKKYFHFFLILMVIQISCTKDMHPVIPQAPTSYSLPIEYKKLIPTQYRDLKKLTFTDVNLKEKVLNISYVEGVYEFTLTDRTVKTEVVTATLTEEGVNTFSIGLAANFGILSATEEVKPSMGVSLRCHGYLAPSIGLGPTEKLAFPGYYAGKVVLNGVTFEEVYASDDWAKQLGQTSYTEVFYHRQKGIIGFRDINNALWILKE
jgi:hypothetical protein